MTRLPAARLRELDSFSYRSSFVTGDIRSLIAELLAARRLLRLYRAYLKASYIENAQQVALRNRIQAAEARGRKRAS